MLSFFKSKSQTGTVGLEIRTDGLSLALAKPGDLGQLQVIKCVNRDCSATERVAVLTQLVAEYRLSGLSCNLVLPADQYQTYPIEKPKVESHELAEAARWRIKDMLDFDLETAVTDVYDFPKDALRGRSEQLNVVVCRKPAIKNYCGLVLESGLKLVSIDIADLALRNVASLLSGEDQRAVSLLYLRAGSGIMVLVKGGILYLARHFDFSVTHLNDPAHQDTVIQQLALEVQRSLDYFESQMGQVPPQEINLFGPDPLLPLANMLGGSLSAKVKPLDLSVCYQAEQAVGVEEITAFVALCGALRRVES